MFAVIALGVTMVGTASAKNIPTGFELMMDCNGEPGHQIGCMNYLLGVWDGLNAGMEYAVKASPFCSHGGVQGGQLRLIYPKWATQHPERLNMERGDATFLAFMEAFPCNSK
jgi:hypothetical protein